LCFKKLIYSNRAVSWIIRLTDCSIYRSFAKVDERIPERTVKFGFFDHGTS